MANNAKELSVEEVSDSLSEFQRRFAQLPDVEEPPQTFLHLLGQESKETDWNTILSYFLDPTEPHGYGTDLLEAFLSLLEENSELEFDFDALDFGELEVKSEWVMRDLGVKPDITIYSGQNWFVVIEMKVHAPQTNDQTNKYVCSKKIGNIDKSEFADEESGRRDHNYVYLTPESSADADALEFVNISWREVVETLEQFEYQSHGRYPAKSHAQLNDFLDTIKRELDMTDEDFEENQIEKMRLYLEYADDIDEVRDTFDEWHEREAETWSERFLDGFKPSKWGNEWQADPSSFGQIYRKKWRQTANRQPTDDKDEAPYRIDFVHKPRNRESFRKGKLKFRLYCPKRTDYDFTEVFSRRFHDDEAVDSTLQDHGITRKDGAKMWHTEKTYPFEQEELPNSYYETLQTAFEEHEGMADDITRIFEATLDEIKSE
jgi:hypothetical protein